MILGVTKSVFKYRVVLLLYSGTTQHYVNV